MQVRTQIVGLLWLATVTSSPHRVNAGLPALNQRLDQSTPLEAVQGYLEAAREGQDSLAARYLDLDMLPVSDQPTEGPRLARRLRLVIDRPQVVDLANLNRDPAADPASPKSIQLGALPLAHTQQPIRLERIEDGEGNWIWLFSADTVRAIDPLYDTYGPPFGESLPDFFFRHSLLGIELWQWIGLVLVFLLATVVSFVVARLAVAIARRALRYAAPVRGAELAASARGPVRLPIWAAIVAVGTTKLMLPPAADAAIDTLSRSLVIIAVAWLLIRGLSVSAETVQRRMAASTGDPSRAIGIRTQLAVLRRIFAWTVYVVSAALLLMQFDVVRHIGVSMLASAGVAGLVVGLAAQKSIGTLLAGIQLSITQPIRFGDTVLVEGESGVVEEITLSYVVIRTWDERRMIVPVNYFLEKPFQNWSKGDSELVAHVILPVSSQVDVDAFRAELTSVLHGDGVALWDGKIPNLVAREVGPRTVVLRVLVGAASPDASWPLRSLVERRFSKLLEQHPEWRSPTLAAAKDGPHTK